MNQLSHESRALLDAARGLEGPSVADRSRIRGKISARIAAGFALGSAVAASATVAEAAHVSGVATVVAWLPAAAKVLTVVAIAGGVSVGAVRVSQRQLHSVPAAAPVAVLPARAEPRNRVASGASPLASSRPENPLISGKTTEASPHVFVATVKLASAAKPPEGTGAAPAPAESAAPLEPQQTADDDGLNKQISAIREAREALRAGNGAAALSALNRAFVPGHSGPLAQEAMFLRVSGFCLQGNTAAARHTGEQFLANYPASPLCAKIRSTCAFP